MSHPVASPPCPAWKGRAPGAACGCWVAAPAGGVRLRVAASLAPCVGPLRDRGTGDCLVLLFWVFKLGDGAWAGLLWVPRQPGSGPRALGGAAGHGTRAVRASRPCCTKRDLYGERNPNPFPRRKAGLSLPRGSGSTLLPQVRQNPVGDTWGLSGDRYFSLHNFHLSSLTPSKAPAQDESETSLAGPLQMAEGLLPFAFYKSKSSNIVYIPVQKTKVSSHC